MKTKKDYESLALKIVPPSNHRPVSQLRSMIAETLEKEINSALTKQREDAFPDLKQRREELEDWRKRLEGWEEDVKKKQKQREKEKEKELEEWKQRLVEMERGIHQYDINMDKREEELQKKEKSLQSLLFAFESYEKWLQGDGEIDDNSKRFGALQRAYNEYKNQKEKK